MGKNIGDLPGPKSRPLLGNVREIRARPLHHVLEDWGREFGRLYRFRIMRKEMLATSDRDMIAALLRDRPDMMRRSSRTAEMLNEIGTRGLFTAEGEDWRRQRKLVMRALTPEVIHNFFPTLAAMTDRLRLRWERALAAGQPVDLLRDLKAYTLDVTIGLAMGQDINTLELEEHPLQRDIEFLFKLVARRLTTPARTPPPTRPPGCANSWRIIPTPPRAWRRRRGRCWAQARCWTTIICWIS